MQADLRVFGALGAVGLSAVTALTVQNSLGVRTVTPVSRDLLVRQIEALLEDCAVQAVKIGMLAGAEQVRAVAEALRRFRPQNIVLDPVLASSGGLPLLDAGGRTALIADLLPLCDLLTPNLSELATLSGMTVNSGPERIVAARKLLDLGARAVLIKGGHLVGEPVDVLVRGTDNVNTTDRIERSETAFTGRRVDTPHTHGTGCFLSSAIAAYLATGMEMARAIGEAKALLTCALETPVVLGAGRGYPDVIAAARLDDGATSAAPPGWHEARLRTLTRGLYVIIDPGVRPDRSLVEIAGHALAGGASVIQLRDKRMATPQAILTARRLGAIAHDAGALFILNDSVAVALAADADGVHLGTEDMQPADARRLLGRERLIGVSTGTVEEATAMAPYASYLGVGAIFGSKTKLDAGDPVGTKRIREIRMALGASCPPIVAVGGIDAGNIASVAEAGASAAAVISAVASAGDMLAATQTLITNFRCGSKS